MPNLDDVTRLTQSDRQAAARTKQLIDVKLKRLREVVPCVLDLSCREASLPAPYGHTVEDKNDLLRLAKEFGFTDLAIASFFDFPTVDEAFAKRLADSGDSMDGYFANLTIVQTQEGQALEPSYAMQRIAETGIPNVMALIEVRPATIRGGGRGYRDLFRDIDMNVRHMREALLPEPTARRGRIYARFLDIFDAWDEDPELVVQVLKLLQAAPIEAVIFEDVRGTHFPFQTAELVKLIRHYTPPPRLILVHPHSGNGMEDATTIEAVLAGADGVWAGFTPHAAQGAHGSSLMLLSNLLRAGNPHVDKAYDVGRLMEIADRMSRIHMGEAIHRDHPVIGERAYHYIDRLFEQHDLPCDLAPERIGQEVGYRITPAWANPQVIARRLAHLGYPPSITENENLIRQMRILMAEANITGHRILADDPDEIARLVKQAEERVKARKSKAAE